MTFTRAAAALALVVAASIATAAHHSFAAEFDRNKTITLTGVVTKLDWVNPHVFLYVDVTDEKGTTANWALECNSINNLVRAGWTRRAVKPGDKVTVEGYLARDGSKLANAQSITMADGRKIFGQGSGNYPTPR